jgi:signal transduction histidine kinase
MSIEVIVAFILVIRMRKILREEGRDPELRKIFDIGLFVIPALFVASRVPQMEGIATWLLDAVLLYLVYLIYTRPALSAFRTLMFAFLPLVAIAFLSDLIKLGPWEWNDKLAGYIKMAYPFAVIWMVAMLIIDNKQRKALAKEKQLRMEEEAQKMAMTARKDQLEVLVAERTAEITRQKDDLEHALVDLKATQAQLVQREKMASLGELTAGIAHEIQNPLNFVNNFSELNAELATELREELAKLPLAEADRSNLEAIAADIVSNQEKIAFHGKRAEGIVKGMLQHSRSSTGEREPTDINELCDEYLRLAYHGMRAKDKSFNATLKTDFDETIGKVSMVPQDIGRVLLNLITNALYALGERKKLNLPGYVPTLSVSTLQRDGRLEIRVEDNAGGIPEGLKDKIFQPFFTTKPTGEGTGLGLSISYDIITKGHNGSLEVESKEGEGTGFTITLPAS